MDIVQTYRQPHPTQPRVADQFQGNWLGATHRGSIGMANRRREFTCPTMSELPVDHAAPLVMAVDSQWETSMKLDEEQEDTHGFLNPLALPEFQLHLKGLSLLRTIRQIYLNESCKT